MALTALELVRDNINGVAVGLNASGYVLSRSLAANTAESMTVPTGGKFVNFSATGNIYVNFTTTATVPGDVTNGSASVLNPGFRSLEGASAISIIAPAACVVTAEFWS